MKIYFLSSLPCALTINGCYFGITDKFERFADLALQEKNYISFQPGNAHPIGFFLTEDIRFSPPDGCEVYLVNDGIAIYACDFPPINFSLRPITQVRDGKRLATLFFQGPLQLSIESEHGFFISTLPPSFQHSVLKFYRDYLFVEGQNCLAVYACNGERLLMETTLSYSLDGDILTAKLPLCDSLGRSANCCYRLSEQNLERISFTLEQARDRQGEANEKNVKEDLLAYAFFESVLIGADCTPFLCEDLQKKANELTAFLGNFVNVILTPSPNVCGLVRKKSERLYEVAYFQVEIQNEQIIDIKG